MELTLSEQADYILAHTQGPIDETAGTVFRERLHPLVGVRGTKVVLDISGSPRINSVGISNLVRLVSDANTNSSRVVLAGATPFVASVLNVSRLDRFFDLVSGVPEAVALLQGPAG